MPARAHLRQLIGANRGKTRQIAAKRGAFPDLGFYIVGIPRRAPLWAPRIGLRFGANWKKNAKKSLNGRRDLAVGAANNAIVRMEMRETQCQMAYVCPCLSRPDPRLSSSSFSPPGPQNDHLACPPALKNEKVRPGYGRRSESMIL